MGKANWLTHTTAVTRSRIQQTHLNSVTHAPFWVVQYLQVPRNYIQYLAHVPGPQWVSYLALSIHGTVAPVHLRGVGLQREILPPPVSVMLLPPRFYLGPIAPTGTSD